VWNPTVIKLTRAFKPSDAFLWCLLSLSPSKRRRRRRQVTQPQPSEINGHDVSHAPEQRQSQKCNRGINNQTTRTMYSKTCQSVSVSPSIPHEIQRINFDSVRWRARALQTIRYSTPQSIDVNQTTKQASHIAPSPYRVSRPLPSHAPYIYIRIARRETHARRAVARVPTHADVRYDDDDGVSTLRRQPRVGVESIGDSRVSDPNHRVRRLVARGRLTTGYAMNGWCASVCC